MLRELKVILLLSGWARTPTQVSMSLEPSGHHFYTTSILKLETNTP